MKTIWYRTLQKTKSQVQYFHGSCMEIYWCFSPYTSLPKCKNKAKLKETSRVLNAGREFKMILLNGEYDWREVRLEIAQQEKVQVVLQPERKATSEGTTKMFCE